MVWHAAQLDNSTVRSQFKCHPMLNMLLHSIAVFQCVLLSSICNLSLWVGTTAYVCDWFVY